MKFSENWLREFVDIDVDRDELLQRLTMAGLEVEDVELIGASLERVVVGEIVACTAHPNADKLRVCEVDIGAEGHLPIVCGAANARVGLKAPLALIGAVLPTGVTIKRAALRGVESNGMLCSARELGIDADAAGLMELAPDAPVGAALAGYLGLPDASIEIKLTPNRPDCLCVLGVARDVAALLDSNVRHPLPMPTTPADSSLRREVRIAAAKDCPRYLGRVIEGIDAMAKSPAWLVERLHRAGIRSINAIVDVTQFVMLECGQPLHAFDNDTIQGTVVVRRAGDAEKLKLLDGSERILSEQFLVIADDKQSLALAGIMGGFESRVSDSSRNVFLESAHFAPAAIIGRARILGMHTDASHRFERGVDAELPRAAIERATALLIGIAGGAAGPITEVVDSTALPARKPIALRRGRLSLLLDLVIDDSEVERILRSLGLTVVCTSDGWHATPPSWRFDLAIEEDLIEEVIRIYGYERVATRAPRGELIAPVIAEERLELARLRDQLVARDYVEAVTYAFVNAGDLACWDMAAQAIALANPLSAELAVMRTSLLPGLVAAMTMNLRRQQARVRLFEVGNVFHEAADGPVESLRIGAVACGAAHAEQWGEAARAVDFFDIKGDVESLFGLTNDAPGFSFTSVADVAWLHPGQAARISRNGTDVGLVGVLHPRVARLFGLDIDTLVFELAVEAVVPRALPRATEISRFPAVRRDLSFELPDDVAYADVERAVREAVGTELVHSILFDRYVSDKLGMNVRSLAMGLILQDRYRTLTDGDADRCAALAVVALESKCGATLRG